MIRPRFSLRALLVAFTVAGIVIGGAANLVWRVKNQPRKQIAAIQKLRAIGSEVQEFDGRSHLQQPSAFVALARKWIHPDCYRATGWVQLDRKLSPGEAIDVLKLLRDVYSVRDISLHLEVLTPECIDLLQTHDDLVDLPLICGLRL